VFLASLLFPKWQMIVGLWFLSRLDSAKSPPWTLVALAIVGLALLQSSSSGLCFTVIVVDLCGELDQNLSSISCTASV
jgi:hypothetical protein